MKNLIILFTVLLISLISSAQNWSPIRVNQKMNYQHSDSSYISHTIWVDSAGNTFEDSTFFLNLVVKDFPDNPEIVLRNQPQFFGQIINKDVMGNYFFIEPMIYCLLSSATVGESWLFDINNNVNATLTDITEQEIFGVTDSVKTIELSDGNEILISKNFGILHFPDFENGGYFELVGIQDTEFGESVPGFWEIYDFEVGDVYQYNIFSANTMGGQMLVYTHKKVSILSKSVSANSISYDTYVVQRTSGSSIGGGSNFLYSNLYNEDITYIDSTTNYAYLFNNELLKFWGCYSYSGYDGITYSRINQSIDSLNIPTKSIGIFEYVSGINADLFYLTNEATDTMFKFSAVIFEEPYFELGLKFKKGLGLTNRFNAYWEGEEKMFLEGYVKDGDTVGIITADSNLIVGKQQPQVFSNIAIYPNPSKTKFTIKGLPEEFYKNVAIQLLNLEGKTVKTFNLSDQSNTFSVADFNPGLYIYTITQNQEIIKRGKLIIQ